MKPEKSNISNGWFSAKFSTVLFRSNEVLSASTSNLTPPGGLPALIRRGSDSSLPTNLWSQASIESEPTDEEDPERRGSLAASVSSQSPSRRGSRLLDFIEQKKKKNERKRYKDKQGIWIPMFFFLVTFLWYLSQKAFNYVSLDVIF